MAWPSSDAGTTNLDASTDSPSSARADILLAVQNGNSIKNHVSAFMQGVLDDADAATARTTLSAENSANKDASNGYCGLTLLKINFKNVANTLTSFFTNTNTLARTYTFPDKDMTVAGLSDLTGGTSAGSFTTLASSSTLTSTGKITALADLQVDGNVLASKTITPAGTTGAQTINKTCGSVNFAAGASSLVVTNSLVSVNSVIICTIATNDVTLNTISVTAASGSFTITGDMSATAETRINFLVIN